MKIIQKSLATLLVICMMFSLLPSVMLPEVLAQGPVLGDDHGSFSGAATNRIVGGTLDVNEVVFRTTLSRDPNNYLDGTQEQAQKVIDYYSLRYPDIKNPKTNCIYLWPARVYDKAKHDFGIPYYGNKAISWDKTETSQALNIRLNTSGSSTNVFKNKAIADYNAKKITGPSDLIQYKWKNYLPTRAEALNLLSYVYQKTGNTYQTSERTRNIISQFSKMDPSALNKVQKDDITFGYVGLLSCYYVLVKDNPNTKAIAGNYENSIEEYLGNKNTVEKPVSLVNEVCMSITVDEDPFYNSITLAIPIMDYIRFTLLPENAADMVGDTGAAFLGKDGAKKLTTTQMLEKLAEASLENIPFSTTYATKGTGLLRIADRGGNYMGEIHTNTALGRIACVPQLYKQIISIRPDSTGWQTWNTSNEYPGFLKMLELSEGTGIYGFSIVSHNISNPNPDISYYVDDTTKTSFSRCELEVGLKEPPKITMHIKGSSSLISSLTARKDDTGFNGLKFVSTVTRTKLVGNQQVETNKKMPSLEAEINNLYTRDDLVTILTGQPLILRDMDALGDKYTRVKGADTTVTYIYNIDIEVTIDKEVYKYKKDDIVTKMKSGAPNDFSTCVIPLYSSDIQLPEDIKITKPGSTSTTDIVNPSENENLSQMTQMISRYGYTTNGEEFAEVKNNKPLQEEYEVMGGVPSSEELYFSVGGSEFKVATVVQYWMNEHSRDRTYTVHFDGNSCEYNNEEEGRGDRMKEWFPKAQPDPAIGGGHYNDVSIHCLNPTGGGGGDWQIQATWTYYSTNHIPVFHSCSACGARIEDSCDFSGATDEYNQDLDAANKLAEELGGEIIVWNSVSDKETREREWDPVVSPGSAPSDGTSAGNDGAPGCGGKHNPCGGCFSGDPPSNSCDPGSPHSTGSVCPGHGWTIKMTATIPPHAVCGPCCGHMLPDIYDTWRQGLVYDFAKMSQIRLFKLDQGSVDGMTELTGSDRIFASTMSGNPTYFMNIAQLTEKKPPILQDGVTSGGLTVSFMEDNGTTYSSGENRKLAQSSRAGRLRYILDPNFRQSDTISYSEDGNGSSGSFTINYAGIAAPEQHDDVVYKVGKRSRNCDGMATTGNFGKNSGSNVIPMDKQGHINEWADGILYTNILDRPASSNYFVSGSGYTPRTQKANDTNITKYKEDYNHHVQRNGLTDKRSYSDKADQKDIITPEWKFFDKARRTKVIVNVISDFLILQTSGGDQSIIYHEKASPATEAQEHFQKVKITEDELFTNNVLSVFNKASTCSSPVLKDDNLSNMVVVGGYNGQYNKPKDKYKPYSLVTGEFLPFAGAGTVFDATKKTGLYKPYGGSQIKTIFDKDPALTVSRPKRQATSQETSFKIYQDGLRIIPTTLNKLYTPYEARVFYPQVVAFFSRDSDAFNAETNQIGVGTVQNVNIGWRQWQIYATDYKNRWGTKLGVDANTVYFGVEDDDNTKTVNDVIVYTPVSTEDALVLNQENLNINGLEISRDQRANPFDYPDMNDMVNKLKVCPLDPDLCEYRYLNCKYLHDTVLADFDFSETYKTTEQNVVNGEVVKQDVTKKNTYYENGNWITTNKTTGLEYILPSGFSIESGGQVGDGRYLRATGTRWSIPFGDLSLANAKSNRLAVELDLTVNSSANDLMLISFYNYGFVINSKGLPGSFIARSPLDSKKIGSRADMSRNTSLNHVKLSLVFGFNNVVDCTATVNGVPATVTVSELRNVWETVGGTQKLQLKQETIKDFKKDPPKSIQRADIGSNLNIGSWGSDSAYRADYYIDNLKVILKGGTQTHNSTCYQTTTVHATNKTHTHTADCYLKKDIYTCNNALNANYQHSTNSPINWYNCNGYINAGGGWKYDTSRVVCNHDCHHGSGSYCSSCSCRCDGNHCLRPGYYYYYTGDNYHSHTGSQGSYPSGCYTLGTHRHIGSPGTDTPNGCYTRPTVHKHKSSCTKISAGTLICTGELNTETDFNVHVHNASCLTTGTNISSQAFQANKRMETYIIPYTDDYTIEAYGSSMNNVTGYVKGTVKLTKGTILYIYVGTKDGYNSGITDIRLMPPVNSDGSLESEASKNDSLNSRFFIAGKTAGASSIRSTLSKPITSQTITSRNSDGDGRVYITPKNGSLGNILNNIVNGSITPEKSKDYLGDELYNQLMSGKERIIHTWSGWTTDNDKGFKTLNGYNPLQITGGNLVSTINASTIEFTVDVDISDAKSIKEIKITLDNNTASPTLGVFKNRNRTDDVFVAIKPNTKNQVVSIKPNWTGRITSLEFDTSSGYSFGSTVVRKIELIGYGNKTSNTGEASYVNTEKVVATAGTSWPFNYTGGVQTKTLEKGKYKLEVWGAQGGNTTYTPAVASVLGGLGGYSQGTISLNIQKTIYINVGSQNGYGGGGTGYGGGQNGGGATHIATANGLLQTLSSNRSSILIVAGGGGGCEYQGSPGNDGTLNSGPFPQYGGGSGGGNIGGTGLGDYAGEGNGVGGSQNSGYAFGLGGNAIGLHTGGGGGGWYGGYNGTSINRDNHAGGGGSGYIGGVTSGSMQNGVRSGNGYARITALEDIKTGTTTYSFTPLKITYASPLSGQTQTIINNYDKIPDKLPNGENNPIWLCRFQGYNAHVCQQVDKNGNTINLCRTFSFLGCTEPHHRGEHYGTSNKICWSACGHDENHKNTKTEVVVDKNGKPETVHLATFLQLDAGFTVYFPNRGNFKGNDAFGIAAVQGTRGKGYTENMDTTNWTREKRVRFSFDVIYNDVLHIANQWIELEVPKEYFNFYLPINNNEIANTGVEFEVEAINCGTGVGTSVIGGEKYNNLVDTDYTKTVSTFLKQYVQILLNAVKGGYKVPSIENKSTSELAYGATGYMSFFDNKRDTVETALRNSMKKTNQQIEKDFEGGSSANAKINPHTSAKSGINYNVKGITSNDNYERVDNKMRSKSMESLHGGYKQFYLDIIGRIGNFALLDTEDFRFSEFFKTAIVSRGDAEALKEASNWLVEGVVLKVDDAIQNLYVGDLYDIRGNEASPDTRWLDTYGTQDWMTGQLSESGRDINNKNLISQILTNDINNIDVLKLEPLRYGYDTYTSINTMGNYEDGYLQVIPKYYALKLTDKKDKNMPDELRDLPKGSYIPLDIYINKDGQYIPVNVFENARNGNINIGNLPLYDYPFNLDWTSESERRNYTLDEQAKTKETVEYLKQIFYDYPDGTESEDVSQLPIESIREYEIPKGKNNYLGTSQYILMSAKQRTFIGTSDSYGNNVYKGYAENTDFGINKNKNNVLHELSFTRAIQRWHGKLGIPSSSVFVPHDLEADALTITYVMNDDYAIICSAEMISIGNTWTLYYSQPWFKELSINDEKYSTSSHYPGHRVTDGNNKSVECPNCLPPIIAVYSGSNSSADDLEIINTY